MQNGRSIRKNLIIAISESKIKENTSANLNIPGYAFVNTNSKTQAGGVGLYLSNNLEFSRRSGLDISDDGIESCWMELARTAQKNIVIGCVYRHPKGNRDLFHSILKKQFEQLNTKGHAAKKNYFSKQFKLNKENIKCTWKLISKVIRTKKENTQHTIKKLLRDNRIYIDKQSICDQLNSHFINVGNGLADKLPKHDIDPSVYLARTMTPNGFMLRGICPTEVYDKIMSLKVDKSALDIPRRCIKYAANHIYEALSVVFNQSLLQGTFPENFKVSKVTPIDKGGEEIDGSF